MSDYSFEELERRDVVYTIKSSFGNVDSDESEERMVDSGENIKRKSLFGGGVCVHPSGIIVTSASIIDKEAVSIRVKSRDDGTVYKAHTHIVCYPLDICILFILPGEEQKREFSFFDIEKADFDVVQGEKLFSWVHWHRACFSLFHGVVSYHFRNVVYPQRMNLRFGDSVDYFTRKGLKDYLKTRSYRRVMGVLYSRETKASNLNPHLPLIETHSFDVSMKHGGCGCPVFKHLNNRMIGFFSRYHGAQAYIVPWGVVTRTISALCGSFEKMVSDIEAKVRETISDDEDESGYGDGYMSWYQDDECWKSSDDSQTGLMGKIQESLVTSYNVPHDTDEDKLIGGKREAMEAIEKQASRKKQKLNAVKQTIYKKAPMKNKKVQTSEEDDSSSEEEAMFMPAAKQPVKKAVESCSEEHSSSSYEEVDVKAPSKNSTSGKPATKGKAASRSFTESDTDSECDEEPTSKVPTIQVPAAAFSKNGSVAAKKKFEYSDDSDSDESSSDDDVLSKGAPQSKKAAVNKNCYVSLITKKEESSDSPESEDGSDEEDETPAKVASKAASTKVIAVSSEKGTDDTSDSDGESDESEFEEEPEVAKAQKEDSSSREDSSEEETSESEEKDKIVTKTPKKKDGDIEMVDAYSGKTDIKRAPQTPNTTHVQATGSKTLFMGNLSYSIDTHDVEIFFKDAGEISDVRFAYNRDGTFKGFGLIEFTTVVAAQRALKLNGQQLLGREVRLDLAREGGEGTTPARGGRAQAQGTIVVRGFDTNGSEGQVRSALEGHFGSCGSISRVSVPKDYDGGLKGIAYMDFTNSDGLDKALELDGSELGDGTLTVEVAKSRRNTFGSGCGGKGRGTTGKGGRFGGGSGGGRSRGRGGLNRPSMATPSTGMKTTFYD